MLRNLERINQWRCLLGSTHPWSKASIHDMLASLHGLAGQLKIIITRDMWCDSVTSRVCDDIGLSTCKTVTFSGLNRTLYSDTVYDIADDELPSARPFSDARIRHTTPSKAANAPSRPTLE